MLCFCLIYFIAILAVLRAEGKILFGMAALGFITFDLFLRPLMSPNGRLADIFEGFASSSVISVGETREGALGTGTISPEPL